MWLGRTKQWSASAGAACVVRAAGRNIYSISFEFRFLRLCILRLSLKLGFSFFCSKRSFPDFEPVRWTFAEEWNSEKVRLPSKPALGRTSKTQHASTMPIKGCPFVAKHFIFSPPLPACVCLLGDVLCVHRAAKRGGCEGCGPVGKISTPQKVRTDGKINGSVQRICCVCCGDFSFFIPLLRTSRERVCVCVFFSLHFVVFLSLTLPVCRGTNFPTAKMVNFRSVFFCCVHSIFFSSPESSPLYLEIVLIFG